MFASKLEGIHGRSDGEHSFVGNREVTRTITSPITAAHRQGGNTPGTQDLKGPSMQDGYHRGRPGKAMQTLNANMNQKSQSKVRRSLHHIQKQEKLIKDRKEKFNLDIYLLKCCSE